MTAGLGVKMKRKKCSNGGLNVQKTFNGIGSLEGTVSGNQNYRSGNVTVSKNIGGARVSASRFEDSRGNSSSNYSVEKQLKNKSSVTATKSKNNMGVSYNKQTKGGTNFSFGVNKNAAGELSGSMSISKPL
tara:strand:- start:88 stop:480 length:393 start_codon:yes stop_codon:yes gene_type:complete